MPYAHGTEPTGGRDDAEPDTFSGIFVGAFGLVSALLYFPIYPWWGLFAIIVNTGVVYGLTVHGGEIRYKPGVR